MTLSQRTSIIKSKAIELGFLSCGISKAEPLNKEKKHLENWLNKKHHGEMKWMENHFDKRVNPTLLVEGAKSIVSVALNYFPDKQQNQNTYKVSKYAYGEDYHYVIKDKLRDLHRFISEQIGEVSGRAFVDSAPIMDKAWAKKSGLGWMGKNTNIIHPKMGSFFLLGELIIDMDLEYDTELNDYCGTCTKCIDACPTDALLEPYQIDGSKCISYFTIELKDELPTGLNKQFENWIFGCDICQDVCPWNRFSKPSVESRFKPHPSLLQMSKSEWNELSQETFNEVFKKSAVKRTKYAGLVRNINYVLNTKTDSLKS